MTPSSDLSDLLSELSAADVRYLVVGGYAVAFHSQPRFTKDLDIWVAPEKGNAERVRIALDRFGAPLSDLSVDDLCRAGTVFQIGVAPHRIDILTAIDGVSFDEAWNRRIAGHFGETPMWVIAIADLITNKRASGRPQDLEDVRHLEKSEK